MSLLIDYRESHIADSLNARGVQYVMKKLDIGDFQVLDSDGQVLGIWERKTYSDLASSVTDGRYREQKHRLTTSPARYKGYIIEGNCPNPTKKFHSLQPGALESVKIGLTCRDGFHLLHSTGTDHTAVILEKLIKKIPEYIVEDRSVETLTDHYHSALAQSTVSSVKKENFTPQTCYLAQLSQLPQVSLVTAKAIADRWSHMGSLVSAITSDRQAARAEISNLRTSGRRIGDAVADRILEYLVPAPKKVVIQKK